MKPRSEASAKARRKRGGTNSSRVLVVLAGVAGLALAVFIVKQGELGSIPAKATDRSRSTADGPPFLIQGLDRDGDQRISWREFHIFDRLDLNGDGFVDADEARSRMRARRSDP